MTQGYANAFNNAGSTVVSTSSNLVLTANSWNGVSELTVSANASGGSITITLPSASSVSGRTVNVVKTDATMNAVVVSGDINSGSYDTINTINQSNIYKSNGSKYHKF